MSPRNHPGQIVTTLLELKPLSVSNHRAIRRFAVTKSEGYRPIFMAYLLFCWIDSWRHAASWKRWGYYHAGW